MLKCFGGTLMKWIESCKIGIGEKSLDMILFITLIASIIYIVVMLFLSPPDNAETGSLYSCKKRLYFLCLFNAFLALWL